MNKRRMLTAFSAGTLFALGLGISRVVLPSTIHGFLNFFGDWNPTLMIMMASGVATYAVFDRLARRLPRPALAEAFVLPKQQRIDARVILGATLFGVGWGLAGVCPGPAVTSALYNASVGAFACALLAGVAAYEKVSWSGLYRRAARFLVNEIAQAGPARALGDSR